MVDFDKHLSLLGEASTKGLSGSPRSPDLEERYTNRSVGGVVDFSLN